MSDDIADLVAEAEHRRPEMAFYPHRKGAIVDCVHAGEEYVIVPDERFCSCLDGADVCEHMVALALSDDVPDCAERMRSAFHDWEADLEGRIRQLQEELAELRRERERAVDINTRLQQLQDAPQSSGTPAAVPEGSEAPQEPTEIDRDGDETHGSDDETDGPQPGSQPAQIDLSEGGEPDDEDDEHWTDRLPPTDELIPDTDADETDEADVARESDPIPELDVLGAEKP